MADPRDARLRRLYDITGADWDAMFAAQGGRCAICGRPLRRRIGEPGALATVDHDHRTGKVRGLLCAMPCNRGLREWMTLTWLEQAVAYLSNHPVIVALGRQPQGVIGRVTSKRRRRSTRGART